MSDASSPSTNRSAPLAGGLPILADVIIPRHLNRPFTYLIPPRMQARLAIGSRVRVPFGSTTLQGVVVSLFTDVPDKNRTENSGKGRRLREVIDLLDESPGTNLPSDLIELSRVISERYLTPWGQCLRLILPPTSHPKRTRYSLTDSGRAILDELDHKNRLSPTSRSVLSRLGRALNGLSVGTLRQGIRGALGKTLASLKHRRFVQEVVDNRADVQGNRRRRRRLPPSETGPTQFPPPPRHTIPPTAAPTMDSMHRIRTAIANQQYARIFLQIPIHERFNALAQAAQEALSHHRTVLIVTPEIARAETLAAHFKSQWGARVDLFHGGLSATARAATWSRTRQGVVRLVVGTRSAIFCPLPSLGLICVEDEHDPSLKEETEPRYHARDVASMRALRDGAALLLISAHPSLETFHAANQGRNQESTTHDGEHAGGSILLKWPSVSPAIQVIDLRQHPSDTLLCEPMVAGIQAALDSHVGVMLFLNRKGFASALLCRECGRSLHCPHCSIALTFYKQARCLSCRYCGSSLALPDVCPFCSAAKLEPVGAGTERIEAIVRRLFPKAKIGRLDREVSRAQADATRRHVLSGEIEILIGTQMLFHGCPLPLAGFIGLVRADAGLHLPDFRAGERTFHALMDVVAMARPRESGGNVVLQTYLPTHHVIAAVAEQNPVMFYDQELAFRRMLAYPPFAHLIGLRVTGTHEDRVRHAAEQWANRLRAAAAASLSTARASQRGLPTWAVDGEHPQDRPHEVSVLGSVPSAVTLLRGRYRWQLLVKSTCAEAARMTVRMTLDDLERTRGQGGLKYEVDVDPVAMM